MLALALLVAFVSSAETVPVKIINPANQTQSVGVTGGALNVSGRQGAATDGGVDWPVRAKITDGTRTVEVSTDNALKVEANARPVASANNAGVCVSVGAASTTVLASNSSRRAYGFKASEANTANVHCKLGATATTSNTVFGAGASWSQDTGAVYTGVIDCIAASGTQSVCPYELN